MIFTYKNIFDLRSDSARIVEHVNEKGYCAIRGLYDRDDLRSKLKSLYEYANTVQKGSSAGTKPKEIKSNIAKWSIGGQSKVQADLPRFMLTVYNTFFSENIFNLHPDFTQLIKIRDAIAQRDALTDDILLPERYNGCRVQIYPSGGGFMGMHTDTTAVSSLRNKADTYIQLVLLLTERGVDYHDGGAFTMQNGDYVDTEKETQTGDILVYDGATLHGVSDIDSNKVFDANDLRGRAVALVTIYKNVL